MNPIQPMTNFWQRYRLLALLLVTVGCGDSKIPEDNVNPRNQAANSDTTTPATNTQASSPDRPTPATPTDDQGKSDQPTNTTPVFSVNSVEFAKEFDTDRDAAIRKYANKLIELTGTVKKFELNNTRVDGTSVDEVQIVLPGVKKMLGRISFEADVTLSMVGTPLWTKALPGQSIRVRGVLDTIGSSQRPILIGDPALKISEIVEAKGDPPIALTPQVLSANFAAEKKSLKLAQTYLIVEGEIELVKQGKFGNKIIKLRHEGEHAVECHLLEVPGQPESGLQPNQKVKLLGVYELEGRLHPEIYDCIILGN